MASLKVFVSSTCYDLGPIRDQLRGFIKSMGYEPVMSDYDDLVYDFRDHTHTSCVKEIPNCDMVILLVGSRFGGRVVPEALSEVDFNLLMDKSKSVEHLRKKENISITQLEILKSVELDIPIFTFVEGNLWGDHALYERNKANLDLKNMVFPSIEKHGTAEFIFEFINFLRHRTRGNSINNFSKFTDIENTLRKQWAGLFQRLLGESRDKLLVDVQVDTLSSHPSQSQQGLQEIEDTLKRLEALEKQNEKKGEEIDKMKKDLDSFMKEKQEEVDKIIKDQKTSFSPDQQNKTKEYMSFIDAMNAEKTSTYWFIKGTEAHENKDYEQVIECFEKVTKLDPNNSYAYNNLGLALNNLGRYKEAIKKYKKATELDPNDTDVYTNWGGALDDLGKYAEAIEKYKKATELDPNNANAYTNWGVALSKLGKYEEALEKYKKATELDPNNASAYTNWGNSLNDLGKYAEATEKYKKATELDPNNANAYYNWGNSLDNLGKYEEAIEKYKKATKLNPKNANAYNNLGLTLSELERYEEAIENHKKAIELDSEYAAFYKNLGITFGKFGKSEEEMKMYEKAIELDPKNVGAYICLGGELDELGRYDEAIEMCKKAIELDPNNADVYNNWGMALNGLNEYEEAKEKLNRSIQLYGINNSESANAYRHLAVSYLGLGEIEKVIPALEKAESLNPEYFKTYATWDEILEKLKETNDPSYADEVEKFKKILEKNKDLDGLKDEEEFQEIYKKYL